MKLMTMVMASFMSLAALAIDVTMLDYQDWNMTDISTKGLKKEKLFTQMDRKFVKPNKSICSNRAHMWAADFKTNFDIDTGKIFLFYVAIDKDEKKPFQKTWWYHVAPIVNDKGIEYVLDAGFRGFINGPLTVNEWLKKFAESTNCKELRADEPELTSLIFKERAFPKVTSFGKFDCYYKKTPHTFWNPESVVRNLLGHTKDGTPVRVERPRIEANELYQACREATTTNLGYSLGTNKKECDDYVKSRRL